MSQTRSSPRPPVVAVLAILCAMIIASALGWRFGYQSSLTQLQERSEVTLSLAANRLIGQLERYRQLPSVLATHPDIVGALSGKSDSVELANDTLMKVADRTSALDIYLMNAGGTTVATSNWNLDRSFLGRNFAFRPYFTQAMSGSLGRYHAVGTTSNQRGIYFAYGVRESGGGIVGAIVVKVNMEAVETQWRGDDEVVFFTDENGVIFLGNNNRMLFGVLGGGTGPDDPQQYGAAELHPFKPIRQAEDEISERWSGLNLPGVPPSTIHMSSEVPQIGLNVHILNDITPLRRQALFSGALAAAMTAIVGLGYVILVQRRRALAERLLLEEQTNTELEKRVAERTEQLSRTRDDLVQASKLAALGEMSAGISHELNQPLAAIQSFAENAGVLLERDRPEEARQNLNQISDLAARMGRIIKNLRAFARKAGETVTDVDLVSVVDDALEIAGVRLKRSGVLVHWNPPASPAMVRGGDVRLQQVVVNLLSNAIDAMEGQERREIFVDLAEHDQHVSLAVRDVGTGLRDPDKVFDPFYSTKSEGRAEGLGLGLSISYGIVSSFGGAIRAVNHPEGGAVFTVSLPRAAMSQAAE